MGGFSSEVGNIDPAELPISDSLQYDLLKWAEKYDETLNISDPASSGFQNEARELEFKKAGQQLAARLKLELGAAFNVITKF